MSSLCCAERLPLPRRDLLFRTKTGRALPAYAWGSRARQEWYQRTSPLLWASGKARANSSH